MIDTLIFDLGGVLIDWDPKYLYSKLFDDELQARHFLATVCTPDWNEEQDAGRSLAEGTEQLISRYPQHAEYIRAYYGRWEEMLNGAIERTLELFKQLKASKKYKLYALTNWSEETFPIALRRFEFLNGFDGIVVSGTEKIRKPSAAFYRLLLDRYGVQPDHALFIDDNARNTDAAASLGIHTIHFTSAEELSKQLKLRGIL